MCPPNSKGACESESKFRRPTQYVFFHVQFNAYQHVFLACVTIVWQIVVWERITQEPHEIGVASSGLVVLDFVAAKSASYRIVGIKLETIRGKCNES